MTATEPGKTHRTMALTYQLTKWAVLRDWLPLLVPVDIGWGVVLTAVAAWVGKQVHGRAGG